MHAYPLAVKFKLAALAPEVRVVDANGQTILYLKQKLMSLRGNVKIYADDRQQELLYQINSDSIVNFSANYSLRRPDGTLVGTLRRQGMKSLWRASYPILDANGVEVGLIHETNPWVKVLDSLLGEIVLVGWLIALLFNPTYAVDLNGQTADLVHKRPSVFARTFTVESVSPATPADEELVLPSILTMLLHERARK